MIGCVLKRCPRRLASNEPVQPAHRPRQRSCPAPHVGPHVADAPDPIGHVPQRERAGLYLTPLHLIPGARRRHRRPVLCAHGVRRGARGAVAVSAGVHVDASAALGLAELLGEAIGRPAYEEHPHRVGEARNGADSIAYQVERQLRDLGDRVPLNEKARAEQLIGEIRELVKNNSADVARLRQLSGDLQQVAYGLASSGGQADAAGGGSSGGPRTGGGDDVIDAEFKQT